MLSIRQNFERIRFLLIFGDMDKANWLRKKKKFAMMGEHILWHPRKYPLEGQFLKLHNNIAISANVDFTIHDVCHFVFNYEDKENQVEYFMGCIEIFDNVMIGANSRIMPNVKIGPNAIVAAGSLVTKDVPPGTIVGGVPARVIGSYDALKSKRMEYSKGILEAKNKGIDLNDYLWQEFYKNKTIK